MSRPLTIVEQASAMKADWPTFQLFGLNHAAGSIGWTGEVKPQYGRFVVEVLYARGLPSPRVRVLEPELLRLPGNEEGALPHVYQSEVGPVLCLFDPKIESWDPSMKISRTTVPWTLDWLACYEHWTMTGKWFGGGRHFGQPIIPYANPPQSEIAR